MGNGILPVYGDRDRIQAQMKYHRQYRTKEMAGHGKLMKMCM